MFFTSRTKIGVPASGLNGSQAALSRSGFSPGIGPRQFRRLAEVSPGSEPPFGLASRLSLGAPNADASFAHPRDVFTPTQPKPLGPLFIGRDQVLNRLVCAIEEERSHVVLFGDRGRGKTSLANAVASLETLAGHVVLRQTCGEGMTFEGLFRGAIASAPSHAAMSAGGHRLQSPADLLPDGPFGPPAVISALLRFGASHTIVILDEFDRIACSHVRAAMTETIKGLSDQRAPVTLFLVGVSQSLNQLLGQHPSVERNILGLHLARMTDDEIGTLLDRGAEATGLTFAAEVSLSIQRCSRGMPYYAHLLGLLAARAAAQRGSRLIDSPDFIEAAAAVRAKLMQEIGEASEAACVGDGIALGILLAAARAPCDVNDRFEAAAVLEQGSRAVVSVGQASMERLLERLSASRHPALQVHATAAGPRFSFIQPSLANLLLLSREARLEWFSRVRGAHA